MRSPWKFLHPERQDPKHQDLKRQRQGVTSIEYALIAMLIALVIIGAIRATGANLGALYNDIMTSIVSALS